MMSATPSLSIGSSEMPFWQPATSPKDWEIFVCNLPYDMNEEEISTLFSQVGVVTKVNLKTDNISGRSKGSGTVNFADAECTVLAVETLNNATLKGRKIRVSSQYANRLSEEMRRRKVYLGSTVEKATETGFTLVPSMESTARLQSSGVNANRQQSAEYNQTGKDDTSSAVTDVIKQRIVEGMGREDFLEMLTEVQGLVNEHPDIAKEIFKGSPAILFAVLHALSVVEGPFESAFLDAPSSWESRSGPPKPVNAQEGNFVHPQTAVKVKSVIEEYRKECAELKTTLGTSITAPPSEPVVTLDALALPLVPSIDQSPLDAQMTGVDLTSLADRRTESSDDLEDFTF